MKVPRHLHGYTSSKPLLKEVPTPNALRPQLFAGMGASGDIYELRNLPRKLMDKIKKATYLGCGHSSDVWDLGDGTVLKITKEPAVIKVCSMLYQQPVLGLPKIHDVLSQNITHLGFQHMDWKGNPLPEKYVAIIQEKYDIFPEENWHLIEDPVKHLDMGTQPHRWARGSDNNAARGQEGADIAYQLAIIARKMKKQDVSHPLAQCAVAMSTLYQWMNQGILGKNAGLDIDHRDNWAVDAEGKTIMLDPIFTVRPPPKDRKVPPKEFSPYDLNP